jgi:hypothetical protein
MGVRGYLPLHGHFFSRSLGGQPWDPVIPSLPEPGLVIGGMAKDLLADRK